MKRLFTLLNLFFGTLCISQNQFVITKDIQNFWKAYDEITVTKDSIQKIDIIQSVYINQGTEGLQGIMQARRYTAQEYVSVIGKYPLFWRSIRKNTLQSGIYAKDIQKGIQKLNTIYSPLKPAKIYFTIGALRTGGTTLGDKVLIGSEIAMADATVNMSELDKNLSHLQAYFETNPVKDIVFLNVHEFIHTQQKTTIGNTLLSQTVLEGVCEYVATIALNKNSPNPQIIFGKQNDKRIKDAYVKEMFSSNFDNWLWNSPDNELQMRDLAYYVGFAICEKYYLSATDKKRAIKRMIELDYTNEDSLISFVEESNYFENKLSVYKDDFEKSRPTITNIAPFTNGGLNVDTAVKIVTIYFSQPMNKKSADFDIGNLGNNHVMWIKKRNGFSKDGLSYSIEIQALVANKHYQLLITDAFVNQNGIPLKPYLIDMTTRK